MMKVELILKENIKPSCPTPSHLKSFKLSLLDQLAPSFYVPLLRNDNSKRESGEIHDRCRVVKNSLAETLSNSIHCNDDGVDYFETKVSNCQLSQLIRHPNVYDRVRELLPCNPYPPEVSSANRPLSVQVNVSDNCGGIVIGLCISHKLADGSSIMAFINDWATVARGISSNDHCQQIKGPTFELQSLFAGKDLLGSTPPPVTDEVLVAKSFVFGASKLAELKAKSVILEESSDAIEQCQPTRVEALSALIWRCFIDIDQAKNKGSASAAARVYEAAHAVNMRTRMVPPLPTNSFGNMYTMSRAICAVMKNDDTQDHDLVGKIKDSFKNIGSDYVRELQSSDTLLSAMDTDGENSLSGQTVKLNFSSWCRFPIYEADFGWGKPTWVDACTAPLKNLVWLKDTSSGDGIEATAIFGKNEMAEFERHEELLAYIS
ncbi:hypothetical protein MKW98_010175 [Papaver atlanticum]|uniref:Transferase n=1 Tax=Papaver atlanticum TaxID=357466 RepID=A0AAD4RXM5_9MAGN|nr:hypothetical protein MKW98_010175 [Papaver atlanticum]